MDSIAPARTGCPYRPFSRGSLNRRSLHDPPPHAATTCHKCRTHTSAAKVCAPCQGDLVRGGGRHQVTSTDGITLSDREGRDRPVTTRCRNMPSVRSRDPAVQPTMAATMKPKVGKKPVLSLDDTPQPGDQRTLIPAARRHTRLIGHKLRSWSTSTKGFKHPGHAPHRVYTPCGSVNGHVAGDDIVSRRRTVTITIRACFSDSRRSCATDAEASRPRLADAERRSSESRW